MGSTYPIGKYWRTWLREQHGITEPPHYTEWEIDYEKEAIAKARASKIHTQLWAKRKRKPKNPVGSYTAAELATWRDKLNRTKSAQDRKTGADTTEPPTTKETP